MAEANQALLDWIVTDFQAFSVVDNEFFRKFLALLNYTPICRQTASNNITSGLSDVRANITKLLATAPSGITCTTDGWTSIANESYTAVTAHFLNESWVMQGLLIGFVPTTVSHTGENLRGNLTFLLQFCNVK